LKTVLSDSRIYKGMGNSVVIDVIEAIAIKIKESLIKNEKKVKLW